ncbi:hypothetical protein GQ600_17647 [Phytophthora cactorum]|nr:hypothetical protein GQ600_17647 [Phytophthora cactorum]
MGPTLQIKPPIYIKKIYPTQGPTFPARAHKSLESRTPEPSHGTSKSSSGTNAQNNLVFMERLYARKVLNLLHLTEFTILVEYIEVVVPVVYSIYVVAMSYFPNRIYYAQLAYMDADNLQNTLSNVLLYSFLEFVSLVVLAVFLRRTMEYSPVNQLAFVLRTQWKMVQSKLVLSHTLGTGINYRSLAGHGLCDLHPTGSERSTLLLYNYPRLMAMIPLTRFSAGCSDAARVTCALDYDKPEAVRSAAAGATLLMYFRSTGLFVRLMMFASAIVLYGDVIVPIIRLARGGEVFPLPTIKLVLHCIWVWNTCEQNAGRAVSLPAVRGPEEDAAAADAPESLHPVTSNPVAVGESFNQQRLAALIRSSTTNNSGAPQPRHEA